MAASTASPQPPAGLQTVPGSVVAPRGFRAAGVFCDIKRLGTGAGSDKGDKRDLAMILSDQPAAVAGLFTTNQICAAPVKLCQRLVRAGRAQAIVANSGNANACTGAAGDADARAMGHHAARVLKLAPSRVLVASTGRIGVPMPMSNVLRGIDLAAQNLGRTRTHADRAAEAIMTSDSRDKQMAVAFKLGGVTSVIGGVAKGAGMIQPGMSVTGRRPAARALHATMLGFLTTDAAVHPVTLRDCLELAVARSFNCISVDGDMSTNDTVLVMANGMAGNAPLTGSPKRKPSARLARFQAALNFVCLTLAQMIVRDGEGASRFVTVRLSGARSATDAEAAVRAVANSQLVRTSWCGGDPNWGRIIDALGYSSAKVVESKVDIAYSPPGRTRLAYSLKGGQPTGTPFANLCRLTALQEFDLHIHLHLGSHDAVLYSSDLTEAYVAFNKGNVADPSTLGG